MNQAVRTKVVAALRDRRRGAPVANRVRRAVGDTLFYGITGGKNKLTDQEWYDRFLRPNKLAGKCPGCGKATKFVNLHEGYREFCGRPPCPKGQQILSERFRQAFESKYGVSNPSNVRAIARKRIRTIRKRHGVDNAGQLDWVKEKAKATCLERYGVEHHMKSADFMKKYARRLKQLGITYPFCRPDWPDHFEQVTGYRNPMQNPETKERVARTNIERYGAKTVLALDSHRDATKKKCRRDHGVDYYIQIPNVAEKAMRNSGKLKQGHYKSVSFMYMGSEDVVIRHLIDRGVEFVTGFAVPRVGYSFEGKRRSYIPDIYLPASDTLIEVKTVYSLNGYGCRKKNMAKFAAAMRGSRNFMVCLVDKRYRRGFRLFRKAEIPGLLVQFRLSV